MLLECARGCQPRRVRHGDQSAVGVGKAREVEAVGAGHERVAAGRLTPERLAAHKLLFVNLVSAEREPFLVSEILAIRSFIEQGGSLLVITDHSNCYYHTYRLKPLFEQRITAQGPPIEALNATFGQFFRCRSEGAINTVAPGRAGEVPVRTLEPLGEHLHPEAVLLGVGPGLG